MPDTSPPNPLIGKIVNFLLIFLLTVLTLQFFFLSPSEKEYPAGVSLFFEDNSMTGSFVVPHIPEVNLYNNTSETLVISPCSDITIENKNGNFPNFPSDFCGSVEIKPQSKGNIPFDSLQKVFLVSWQYFIEIQKENIDLRGSFEVTSPGFFRSFFTHVFYAPVYNLFIFFLNLFPGHNLGLTIICVTILIRIVLLYPQHRVMVNQKQMQAIQPKIKNIQKQYKWNQAKIWQELLALYKKENVNPLGSCLPLFLQMPILIVLYWVILEITNTENMYYIYSVLEWFDLTKINTYFLWGNLLDSGWIYGFVLALSVWVIQWIQMKLSFSTNTNKANTTPQKKEIIKKTETDMMSFMPDQEVMNRFMLWVMPTMIAIFTYTFPSGVGIYWGISTLFMLFQQMFVNALRLKSKKKKTN